MNSIKETKIFRTSVRTLSLSLLAIIAATPVLAQETNISDVYGRWLTGDATVEIGDCGDGTPCGYIIKVDAQRSQSDPLLDEHNPEKSQQSNTLVGTRILHGFINKKGHWRHGRIYNPANGKSYSSRLELETPTKMVVKGCIGPFCQKQIWVRKIISLQQKAPNHVAH
ncbi:MAG: DUF2147 domain-containing protein [Litorimonas sp.]